MIKRMLISAVLMLAAVASLAAVAGDNGATALVTGANRGLGLEFARQLKAGGFQVIGTARKPGEATELRALGVRVEQLDVSDAASVNALAARLDGLPIDLLINNAGMMGHNAPSFAATDFDKILATFDVNSMGPMRVTQALLDNLLAGEGKTVIQISSGLGSIGNNQGGYYGYRSSKAALNMLNKSLALELAEQGLVCVVLHPGWVQTRMGGAEAPLVAVDSVSGMLSVIDKLQPQDNGRFLDYQGNELPW